MDIRCKNCGQMIDGNDKYCRYCGYLIPEPPKEPKLTKKQLEDKLQEEKTVIKEDDILKADYWDTDKLKYVKVGEKSSLRMKNVIVMAVSVILAIGLFALAIVMKTLDINSYVAFIILFISILAMFFALAVTVEKYFNINALNNLKERQVIIRRYGLKKPAEFLIDKYVFRLDILGECNKCEGEIIGDLHIERIENKLVVVCNINRKHIWTIDENAFFDKITGEKSGLACDNSKSELD